MAGVRQQPVGDIGRGVGVFAQGLPQHQQGRGQAIVIRQAALRIGHPPPRRLQAQPAIADRTADHQGVARPRSHQRDAERLAIDGQALGEGGAPSLVAIGRPGGHQEIAERFGGLGGKIREAGAQQSPRDDVGRLASQHVDALDHGVLRNHQIETRSRRQHGRVVLQVQRAGVATRQGTQAGDPGEFVRRSVHRSRVRPEPR